MRDREGEVDLHLAFGTRAMRLTLARLEMLLWTALLPRRQDIWAISGVGTTSWFLLPVSTCARAFGQPSNIDEFCAGETSCR